MTAKEILHAILDELNNASNDFIQNIPNGDFLRGNINFAVLAKDIIEKYFTQMSPWVSVTDRLPTKDEYLKNDGRFIADDGNKRYQVLFDICSQKFVNAGGKEDKCIQKWSMLPEPDPKPEVNTWFSMDTLPEDKQPCICTLKFGKQIPFIAQFRHADVLNEKSNYFLDLTNFNDIDACAPPLITTKIIEKWQPLNIDTDETKRMLYTIETTLSACNRKTGE